LQQRENYPAEGDVADGQADNESMLVDYRRRDSGAA
jgi:hypothetical protein